MCSLEAHESTNHTVNSVFLDAVFLSCVHIIKKVVGMRFRLIGLGLLTACMVSACGQPHQTDAQAAEKVAQLTSKEQPAAFKVQQCYAKACPVIAIQTLQTSNPWFNTWLNEQQSVVIQSQIQANKVALSLQPTIDAYVQASTRWQKEFAGNLSYQLSLHSHLVQQKKQYILLMLGLDTQQGMIQVSDRRYFMVADLSQKKRVHLPDLIQVKEQKNSNVMIQQYYQAWLKEQPKLIQVSAPKQLVWTQADWFFDQTGVGLHFRSSEVVAGADQLDIYLTQQQTKQILKNEVYQTLFL